jgi:hypothetical protein
MLSVLVVLQACDGAAKVNAGLSSGWTPVSSGTEGIGMPSHVGSCITTAY